MITSENKFKIADLLQNGKKIEAVKLVRKIYRLGLKEATEEVQAIETEFFPERRNTLSSGTTQSFNVGKVVGGLFTGLGAVFLIIAAVIIWRNIEEGGNSHTITGSVTDLEYGRDDMAAPVIKYQLNGEKKFIHGTVWSNPPAYEIGEEVELLVNDKNGHVTLNSFFDRYFLVAIFGFLGVVFGGIGLVVMRFLGRDE